jgi:hypothetical protein
MAHRISDNWALLYRVTPSRSYPGVGSGAVYVSVMGVPGWCYHRSIDIPIAVYETPYRSCRLT